MGVVLYGFWRSLATYRVRVALNLKNISYEERSIDIVRGQQFDESFSQINPQHVLPALIHDKKRITQSLAILEYIDDIWPNPSLMPVHAAERAAVRALSLITIADTHPLIVPRTRKYISENHEQEESSQLSWARHWLDLGSEAIEAYLTGVDSSADFYACGNAITIADIALASHVVGVELFGANISIAPTLKKITDRCFLNPAFSSAHPLKQADAPCQNQ
jgi:maleylpyruvate isomerase